MSRTLTASEIRHRLWFGLHQLPRAVLTDLTKAPCYREKALERAADILAARLEGLEVIGPDPLPASPPGRPREADAPS